MREHSRAQKISLKGQVAVVTGGGRGIGRAIAQALAAAGASVAVLARSADELAQTVKLIMSAGGLAHAFRIDVTESGAVQHTFVEIERTLGSVEVLVNNAATPGLFGPFWTTDVDEWWRAMDVNLRGQLLCTRAVLPEMIARRRGRIVNVASGAGAMAIPYLSGYVTSKTALVRFTECLATETREFGISVFAIQPGTVRTAMSEYSLNSEEGKKWLPWFRRIFDEGLDVPPQRPAQFVLELASGKADALSGRFLTVSDDLDAILKEVAEVEKGELYLLRLRKLAGQGQNPVATMIAAAAQRPAAKGDKR